MRILQLSDPHVRRPGDPLSNRVVTLPYLEQALAFVNATSPRPDLVIITGDLVDLGLAEEYDLARAALAKLTIPLLVLPGNHDDRAHCQGFLGPYLGAVLAGDCLAYVDDRFPVRIVALDTLIPGSGGGRLGGTQLAWLERTLNSAPDRPTLVAMHHPPFDAGIGFMDRLGLEDRDALVAMLARHPQVDAVVCGHVHRTIIRRLGGAVGMVAPSTAHQIPLDLVLEGPETFIMEPPGYLLHEWDGSGLRSHHAYLADYGNRYLFGSGEEVGPRG